MIIYNKKKKIYQSYYVAISILKFDFEYDFNIT